MPRGDSSLNMLIVAAILALGVGYYVPQTFSAKPAIESAKADGDGAKSDSSAKPKAAAKSGWAASAAGPRRADRRRGAHRRAGAGPHRRGAGCLNDKVAAGDLLVRLDDEELIGALNAALAEAAVRKRERDKPRAAGKPAQDRQIRRGRGRQRRAAARADPGRVRSRLQGAPQRPGEADVEKARDAVQQGQGAARAGARQPAQGARRRRAARADPARSRRSTAARAELSAADAALERTRIRAASAGTILQVNAKVGETATPSPENALVVIGDLSSLRVRAEIEERDIGKVRVGQAAIVRSDAFPGKDFEGKVASLAQALGPSRLGQRGPRKPTDVDVLEVMIDLAGQPPLLPGMRVDVFLRPEATAGPSSGLQQQSAAGAPRAN